MAQTVELARRHLGEICQALDDRNAGAPLNPRWERLPKNLRSGRLRDARRGTDRPGGQCRPAQQERGPLA